MSSPRYYWWGYVKAMIRKYTADDDDLFGVALREHIAVAEAITQTNAYPDGEERLSLISLVFWQRTHTLEGASMAVNVSERTGRRWHTDFIKLVAEKYGLLE